VTLPPTRNEREYISSLLPAAAARSAVRISYQCLIVADASSSDQPSLLVRKFKQCCIIFDFEDPTSDVRSKEVKRICLVELAEFISKPGVFNSEELYMEFMHMVCSSARCIYI